MNDILKRPWLPEWLGNIWNWLDPGPKYIIVFIIWSIIWLWLTLWLGNIEYCPGREYSFAYCAYDWINWACVWSCLLMWFGGAWGTLIQWENREEY